MDSPQRTGPRLVPADDTGLDTAERTVITALREQLPDDATILVNLRITTPRGDRESDAVVVWPGAGVAVVEVKGGHVEYADGTWWVGRPPTGRQIRPVKQALEFKYRLREILREHPRWSSADPRMVHHVAVPFTRLPTGFGAPECPRTLISDRTDLPRLADRIAAQLGALDAAPRPPTPAQATSLVAALTGPQYPQADLATVIAAEVTEREEHCDLLTAQQAKVLDMLRRLPRVRVLGGAGTGKTWLAVEQARRLAADGQQVALLCYSKGLSTWLRRRVSGLPADQRPAYVGTFHALGIQWGATPVAGAPQTYWDNDLPDEMVRHARHLTIGQRFDAVVIDEAQDFAPPWWEPVVAALRDPATGRVVTFADDGQLVFARGALPSDEFATIVLDENLRNTEPITRAFAPYGSRPLLPRGGAGAEVRWVPAEPDTAIEAADAEVERLIDDGWSPEHVMLLTTRSRHPEHVMRVEHLSINGYWNSFWDDEDVFYGSVLGTKGLERPAVVLAVNGFGDPDLARSLLYVGMSRARDLLVVCGDQTQPNDHSGGARESSARPTTPAS